MLPKVLITEPIGSSGLQLLAESCDCITPWDGQPSAGEAAEHLQSAEAVIVRIFRVTAAHLQRAPNLRVIAKHGVGLDNIDLDCATQRGIPVLWTPGSNANAVAEHTLALMLGLTRHVVPADQAVRDGWVQERSQFEGVELESKTLGIVGLGRIGKRVALKAALGLGMNVIAYDPYVDRTDYPGPAQLLSTSDEVFERSDFLSLHVPLTSETRDLVNADTMQRLRPGCRLINTSRGAVVDENALAVALQSGLVAGAALDVYAEEPLTANHPLLDAPNVVLTPHIAGQSSAAMQASSRMAAQGVLDVLANRRPAHVVNPEVLQ